MNFAESIAAPPPTLISTSAPTSRARSAPPTSEVSSPCRPTSSNTAAGRSSKPASTAASCGPRETVRPQTISARSRPRSSRMPARPPASPGPTTIRVGGWACSKRERGGGRRRRSRDRRLEPEGGRRGSSASRTRSKAATCITVIASPGSPSASAVPSRCASSSATEALSAAGSIGWAASPIRTTRASTGPAAGAEVWSARKPRLERHRAGYGLGQPARQVCDEARDRPNRRRGLPLRRGGPERPGRRQNVPEQVAPRADRRLLEHRRGDRLVEADGDLQRVVDDDREPVAQPRGKLVPRTFVEVDIAVDRPEADVACDRRVGDEAAHGRGCPVGADDDVRRRNRSVGEPELGAGRWRARSPASSRPNRRRSPSPSASTSRAVCVSKTTSGSGRRSTSVRSSSASR